MSLPQKKEVIYELLANSYRLSPEEIEEIRHSFKLLDTNGDGHISTRELSDTCSSVMKNLGFNPSKAQLKEMIAELDTDDSGTVDFNEFLQMYAKRKAGENTEEEDMRAAFKTFDRNGDGYITAAELRHVMNCLGEKLSADEVKDIIASADLNGDGKIDYTEFCYSITRSKMTSKLL